VSLSISRHLVATAGDKRFDARLRYTDLDPFAVTLEFTGQPTWTFSRDLLVQGMVLPAGEMDVLVRPVKEGVEITLRSPSGEAVLVFDHNALFDAIQDTLRLVPLGKEPFDFDAEITRLGVRNDY
jgi:hypothetical protein